MRVDYHRDTTSQYFHRAPTFASMVSASDSSSSPRSTTRRCGVIGIGICEHYNVKGYGQSSSSTRGPRAALLPPEQPPQVFSARRPFRAASPYPSAHLCRHHWVRVHTRSDRNRCSVRGSRSGCRRASRCWDWLLGLICIPVGRVRRTLEKSRLLRRACVGSGVRNA